MNKDYSAQDIQVLEGLEPVRKRPGMYIGSTGSKGLHHLIWEIIDNSIDEHLSGHCNEITVELNKDGSISVEDNGRGIPVDLLGNTNDYPKEKYPNGVSAERVILTVLHSGGKFNNNNYKFSGGLHGVGISVVNALSEKVTVEIHKNSKYYKDEYKNGGIPVTKLKNGELVSTKKTNKSGTRITFLPDKEIFETVTFKAELIQKRLKEIAYLNKDLKLVFVNHNDKPKSIFEFKEEDGIAGFVRELNKNKNILFKEIIYLKGERENCQVEFAMQNINDFSENIVSFVNNINTIDGGTHVTGAKTSITKTINKFAKQLDLIKNKTIDGKDIRAGISCVLSIKLKNPQFDGQTKSKLGNSEARTIVEEILNEELEKYFDKNLDLAKKIIEQAKKFEKIRSAENKTRDKFIKNQNSIGTTKLASCQLKNNPNKNILTELYIVEGDSAGGSAKQGRDRKFQAILPLWGKMLNVEKSNNNDVFSNEKLLPIIIAIGGGIGEEFDISKINYDKIIIMPDADVDGSHIITLLMTFIYRFMRPIIENGHLYIAQPPLYKVIKGKDTIYIYNDNELKAFKSKQKNSNFIVQRFKGLGEMNPEELWDTTMNPETRILKQILIEDIIDSDQITTILMGSKVPPRKKFIEDNYHLSDIKL